MNSTPAQERRIPSVFTLTIIQLLIGALLFMALLYQQRDLVILTLLVLGIIGGARLWARNSLANLKLEWMLDRRNVFPGEKIALTVNVENAKLLPIWLELEIPAGNLQSGAFVRQSNLLWFERTRFVWDFVANRRGVYELGPLKLKTGDLFSFFSRRRQEPTSCSIIVFPRLVPVNSFPLSRRDFFGAPRASSPVHDPVYILGTRDYQHRQPSKYIHWKASARHNHLQEKVFEPTTQEKILLAVDVDSFAQPAAEDEFERALEIAASLATRLDREGHSVGFVANGTAHGASSANVPVARTDKQLVAILEMLARIELKPSGDLPGLLRRSLSNAWGVSCVYFARQADDTVTQAKELFAQEKTPAVFVLAQASASVPPQIYRMDDLVARK